MTITIDIDVETKEALSRPNFEKLCELAREEGLSVDRYLSRLAIREIEASELQPASKTKEEDTK